MECDERGGKRRKERKEGVKERKEEMGNNQTFSTVFAKAGDKSELNRSDGNETRRNEKRKKKEKEKKEKRKMEGKRGTGQQSKPLRLYLQKLGQE